MAYNERAAAATAGEGTDLEDIRAKLETMERFFSRRFDEVSAEVNAASQLVGMAEDSVKNRFAEIIGVLEAISHHGDGSSRVQAGVELDAVLKITEDAANRILDAADRIAERLHDEAAWADADARTAAIAATREDVQEILLACSFQDITGQRIQTTIANLQLIESRLAQTLAKFGIEPESLRGNMAHYMERGASQDDIDDLFKGTESARPHPHNGAARTSTARTDDTGTGTGATPDASQSDVDSMFD
jgi:chemotaxis regulatin CheY-phosphate phosphatase CheZ